MYGFDKKQIESVLPEKMSDVTKKIFQITQEKGKEDFYQTYSDYFEYFINIINKVLVKEGLLVSKNTIYYYGNLPCKDPDCTNTPLNHESCIHDIATVIYKTNLKLDKFTPTSYKTTQINFDSLFRYGLLDTFHIFRPQMAKCISNSRFRQCVEDLCLRHSMKYGYVIIESSPPEWQNKIIPEKSKI